MGRLLRAKSLQGINSLSFLSFLDSLPLGEFLNHVDFCKGLWWLGKWHSSGHQTHSSPPHTCLAPAFLGLFLP